MAKRQMLAGNERQDREPGQKQGERVTEFSEQIEELRREGVSTYSPLGRKTPWEQVAKGGKLAERSTGNRGPSHGSDCSGYCRAGGD